MLRITIESHTTPAMLRAIRAACNELLSETDLTTQAAEHNSRAVQLHAAAEAETDKAAAALSAHNLSASTVVELMEAGYLPPPTSNGDCTPEQIAAAEAALVETDSAGQPWSAELHSSSRAKIADGTWKKRRGTLGRAIDDRGGVENVKVVVENSAGVFNAGFTMPAAPPVLPVPTPTAEPIMPKIFALITSQLVTINDAVAAAQAEGYADLGANGLGGAPVEKQLAVLRKLEG